MKSVFQVRVRRGGRIALPKELSAQAWFQAGTTLTLHEAGNGLVVISSKPARLTDVADQLAQQWRAAGLSLESMLSALRQVRKEHDAKKR